MIGVLVHDRPELLSRCLRSLQFVQDRIMLHLDRPEPECRQIAFESGYPIIESSEQVGPAESINALLRELEPGEGFWRVDSDVEVLDDLSSLAESPFLVTAPLDAMFTISPRYQEDDGISSGVVYHSPEVLAKVGAYRSYGVYGCSQNDYYARTSQFGKVGYDRAVRVKHLGERRDLRGARRELVEDCLKVFKRNEKRYLAGEDLYEKI